MPFSHVMLAFQTPDLNPDTCEAEKKTSSLSVMALLLFIFSCFPFMMRVLTWMYSGLK